MRNPHFAYLVRGPWYSLPCDKNFPPKALICKRRMQQIRQAADYTTKHHDRKLICRKEELMLWDSCFEIKWRLHFSPHIYLYTDIYYYAYKQYVADMFSIITRHTLEGFQLHIFGSHSQKNENAVCMKAMQQEGLANDYTRNVRVWEYPCDPKTPSRTFTFVPSNNNQLTHCFPNQLQCSDGSCVAQNHVCNTDVPCASSVCSCEVNGLTVYDIQFCRTACLPSECLCAPHHFQCISGGCIDMASVCDGRMHCSDASDEICDTKFVASNGNGDVIEMTIDNRNFCLGFVCQSGQCLNIEYVDDLLPDCPCDQGEDEAKMLQLRFEAQRFTCENRNHFPCVPGLFFFSTQHIVFI